MNQKTHMKYLHKLINENYSSFKHCTKMPRFIKIHGNKYQEAGLPDLMIMFGKKTFWVELKRDWNDEPTDLQKYNVKDLRNYRFITGFVVEDKFKFAWDYPSAHKFIDVIKGELQK